MNGLWKKRVPAFLLTLVMIVSLMPAALAVGEEEGQPDPSIPSCGGIHHIGDPTTTTFTSNVTEPATCGKAGTIVWSCSICRWQETETIPATGNHSYNEWQKTNDKEHTRECSVCHNKEIAEHNWSTAVPTEDGSKHTRVCTDCHFVLTEAHTHANEVGTRQVSCDLMGGTDYTCSLCGVKYTAIESLSHVDSNNDKICDRCGKSMGNVITFNTNGGTAIPAQTVPAGSTLPTAISDPSKGTYYTFKGWQENGSAAYLYTGQTLKTSADVNRLTFTAPTTFYAIYQVAASGQTGSISANSSIGETLWNHISSKCTAYFGGSPDTVLFTTLGSSASGVLYTSSTQSAANAAQANVYYTGANFRIMTFQPGTSDIAYRLYYTAYDTSKLNSVSGYVDISNQATAGTITITVAPNKTTYFDATQFQTAYRTAGFTDTLSYVTFPNVSGNYANFSGKVYSNSTELTAATLSSNSYTNTTGINALSLRAPSNAKNDSFTTIYRAYSSSGAYAQGTLELKVTGAAGGDISYTVNPGKSVSFNRSDFYNLYRNTTNGTLSYVVFSTPTTSNYDAYGAVYTGSTKLTRSQFAGNWYYYSTTSASNYTLNSLSFQADSSAKSGTLTLSFIAYGTGSSVSGTVEITVSGSASGDINYDVAPGKSVDFKAADFNSFFKESYPGYTLSYVQFDQADTSAFSYGTLYHNYGSTSSKSFSRTTIDDQYFYYSPGSNDYGIGNLTFVATSSFKDTVILSFTAYGTGSRYVTGTVSIRSTENIDDGDITYSVAPGKSVDLQRTAFNTFFRKSYSSTVSYVVFERPSDTSIFNNGTLYCGYGTSSQTSFTRSSLGGTRFYYNKSDVGQNDYYLDDLSFVAGSSFRDSITLNFTAYGEYSGEYVEGKLVIKADGTAAISNYTGSIRYATVAGTNVQINANDIARYFQSSYPTYTLQYVILGGVPATGSLYYNYYNASSYGSISRVQITSSNYSGQSFYLSPTSTSQYALTELTYVPNGSNYCASIPFTAYGTGGASITGSILISVTRALVAEVYGVTPRNTAVTFPASSIYSAVLTATGSALSGIQLLSLPSVLAGSVYIGTGTTRADTKTVYTYASGVNQMGLLRFVPTAAYTGSVEIPYVALDANGTALATGTFSLGVLNNRKTLTDVNSTTWCYKYVMELTDQNVISGYPDGSFKPDSTVTYGAALKLIMLAAGYPEQAPTGSNVFSGYLAKAQADGIVTRSNVSLTAPITRLQVAQLAAGAMKLSTTNLSSVKPFTDTSDVYVQALNAAGIVEGYFSNGVSTFKPSSTLTRGQMSAIVWRMMQYRK